MLINHKCLFHSGTAKKLSRFGYFNTKVQEAYNIIIFWFLMENSILKIFGCIDVKITPDLSKHPGSWRPGYSMRFLQVIFSMHNFCFQLCKEGPVYLRSFLCLVEWYKYLFFSIMQRRSRIFKESFLLGRMIKYLFLQICKEDQDIRYLKSFLCLLDW